MLTAETSAEPGRWRTIPYQKAIMDAFSHPLVEEIDFQKSARVGWTKILGNVIGYHIHQDPCSILMVQPTIEDSEGYSKEEIQPLIAETPVLSARVAASKAKTSASTITKKSYPGGILHLIGANSPRGFRRISVRIVLFDEVDGYPLTAGLEGDQLKLGAKRAETFWNRKVARGSTPTTRGVSRIEDSFNSSSRGYFMLTCPHCGGEHVRRFRKGGFHNVPILVRGEALPESWLHWDQDKPNTAAWMCPECGARIGQEHHRRMVEAGYWFGEDWTYRDGEFTFEPTFDGKIGFFLWAGYSYSPNSTPKRLAREFIDSATDTEKLKTFVNTVLGETWEELGESADPLEVERRAEAFAADAPSGVLILTAGVDVQADRLECEVVGWGVGAESWSVDYVVFPGDPGGDDVWHDLLHFIRDTRYTHQNGAALSLSAICVDAGYMQSKVVQFVLAAKLTYVWPTKGRDGRYPLTESRGDRARRLKRKQLKRGGIRPEMLGVDEGKMRIHRALQVESPGPRYCHFPKDRAQEYYLQLTAESLKRRTHRGRDYLYWAKTRERNEALDCRVMAWAALELSGVDLLTLDEPTPPPLTGASKGRSLRTREKRSGGFGSDGWAL